MSKDKFKLKKGRGSLFKVAKKDRRHEAIRFNGQINIKGKMFWITAFANDSDNPKAPKYNLSLGDKVTS